MSKIKSAEVKKNIVNELANRINQPHYIEYCLDKYFKARLESITDKVIEIASDENDCCDCPYFQGYEDGAKWLKQKLLKDES